MRTNTSAVHGVVVLSGLAVLKVVDGAHEVGKRHE